MSMEIIDGKAISEAILYSIAEEIKQLDSSARQPYLAIVSVGSDDASEIYVNAKGNKCKQVGIAFRKSNLLHNVSTFDVLNEIWKLNEDPEIDGIIVQLPLPNHINVNKVIEAIDVAKDVDGFHPYNIGRLATRNPFFRSCTPFGIMKMLYTTGVDIKGKHAVIVGASNIVGRPLSLELLLAGATVTVCHKFTTHLSSYTRGADILISAVGKPKMITYDMVTDGSIIIDVGISRDEKGKITGDVDFENVKEKASYITPVPGGVGPMTVAMLLSNTLQAYKIREKEIKDLK